MLQFECALDFLDVGAYPAHQAGEVREGGREQPAGVRSGASAWVGAEVFAAAPMRFSKFD